MLAQAVIAACGLAACTLAACGRVGFDPVARDSGLVDANADGDLDAPAVARCRTWSAFGTPVVDTGLSTTNSDDWIPRIGADGLTVSLQDNGSDFDIALSTRTSLTDPFPAASPIPGADTAVYEQGGQFSPDRKRLYLLLASGPITELWQYEDTGAVFAPIMEHTVAADLQHMWISDDELRAYWVPFDGSMGKVMLSQRTAITDAFAGSVELAVFVGGPGMTIALSPDELDLLLSAPMTSSLDDLDIFLATRADRQSMFGALAPITELNTGFDDVIGSWSHDLTTVYVNLDTDVDGGRDADVAAVTRTCLNP